MSAYFLELSGRPFRVPKIVLRNYAGVLNLIYIWSQFGRYTICTGRIIEYCSWRITPSMRPCTGHKNWAAKQCYVANIVLSCPWYEQQLFLEKARLVITCALHFSLEYLYTQSAWVFTHFQITKMLLFQNYWFQSLYPEKDLLHSFFSVKLN